MAKFDVAYSETDLVIVNNKTNKVDKFQFMDAMDDSDAIRATRKEIDASVSASRGAVSLLSRLLNNPRLDIYKGATPANERAPTEFTQACRELEVEYIRPIFLADLMKRGTSQKTADAEWDKYIKSARNGGSYANAASVCRSYFAICGKLPICDNGKLLSVAAMVKLIAIEKDKVTPEASEGIAGKLVKLSKDVADHNEKTDFGDFATGIAALKSMLATYEGLYREQLEKLTELKGNNVADLAASVMPKMGEALNDGETLDNKVLQDKANEYTAKWNAGELSDIEFQIAMADIGMDVEIANDEDMAVGEAMF